MEAPRTAPDDEAEHQDLREPGQPRDLFADGHVTAAQWMVVQLADQVQALFYCFVCAGVTARAERGLRGVLVAQPRLGAGRHGQQSPAAVKMCCSGLTLLGVAVARAVELVAHPYRAIGREE